MLSITARLVVLGAVLAANLGSVVSQNSYKAGSGTAEAQKPLTIFDFCDNKVERLNRISQIKELASSERLVTTGACRQKQVAVDTVDRLLDLNQTGGMCTKEGSDNYDKAMARAIFYNDVGKAMRPLGNFMTALGYQLSGLCKKFVLSNVDSLTAKLEPKDLVPAVELEQYGGFLLNPGELKLQNRDIWPTYFMLSSLIEEGCQKISPKKGLNVGEKTHMKLYSQKNICVKVFIPLFNKVFYMLENLSSDGFDLTLPAGIDFATNPGLVKWLKIKLACDVVVNLRAISVLTQAPSFDEEASGTQVIDNRLEFDFPEQHQELINAKLEGKKEAKENIKAIYTKVLGPNIHAIDKMYMRSKRLVEGYLLKVDAEINKSS